MAGARKIENLPHTRGDEPGGASSDDIREWICPTRVGMNRDFIYCDTDSVKNLPHTRGDEPRRGAHIYLGINDLPHTRGDEPGKFVKGRSGNPSICPTRVGMNR